MKAARIAIAWHPALSVFASEPFLRAAGDDYGWLGGHDAEGRLRCILPFTVLRRPLLRMVRFRVETIPIDGPLTAAAETAFLNSAVAYFRSIGADLILPATTNAIFRTFPDGADAARYGTWEIDLHRSEEALRAAVSQSHRRRIRQAEKNGVRVRAAEEMVEVAHGLIRDTFARSSMGFRSLPAFRSYLGSFGENFRVLVAEREGRVQAAIVVPFSRSRAYYVYGASAPGAVPGAMHLLQWEAIRLFRSLGVASYDFVGARIDPPKGSKQEGLSRFKQLFGARLVEGYVWKHGLNRWKYAAYNRASRWFRGGDIVDQEMKRRPQFSAPLPKPGS